MKPCKVHNGTLIPWSWSKQAGLREELGNILHGKTYTLTFCEKCSYWVLKPTVKKSISLFGLRIQL